MQAEDHSGAVVGAREVFLSYASRDEATAQRICDYLEGTGVPVWMAPRDVPAGALYADAIVRAINACRTLVLVLSQDSVGSSHVGKEIERASSKRKPVVAVRLDATELTPALEYFLSESQWIDARAGLEPALPKLAAGIRRLSVAAVPAAPPRAAQLMPAATATAAAGWRPAARTAAVIAAIVAALLAGWFIATKAGWLRKSAAPVASAAPAETSAPVTVAKTSIAVMPFTDLSEKKDQEYFSDGLSEELIDLLGKVPGLRVPARTSSFYFKGKQATLAEIGKALNVTHVLEGSVRKSGKALRITTELVSVADDSRVWSETYDRQLDDVFQVQDDIAGAVVTALKVSVLGEPVARVAPTLSSDAYLHYLKATAEFNEVAGAGDAFDSVVGELQAAIKLDPSFAQAWLMLGQVRISGFVSSGHGGAYAVARPVALEALQRALSIDPNLAAAHVQLARLYYMMDWDVAAAHRELDRAVALRPNEPDAFWLIGYIADSEGRFDEAIAAHLKGRDIDPLFVDNYRQLGNAYYRAGRLEEGAAILTEAAARFPSARTVHYRLGLIRLAQHRPEDALTEFSHLENDGDFHKVGPPLGLDALGRKAEADRALAEILASKTIPESAAYQVALIYAHRSNADQAFQWLQRALQQRDAGMHWMKFDPLLQGLAAEPRFKALLVQMHQS